MVLKGWSISKPSISEISLKRKIFFELFFNKAVIYTALEAWVIALSIKNDSEKIDASLKFVLGLGTVDMIIVGFELPEQIDNYIGRIKNVRL